MAKNWKKWAIFEKKGKKWPRPQNSIGGWKKKWGVSRSGVKKSRGGPWGDLRAVFFPKGFSRAVFAAGQKNAFFRPRRAFFPIFGQKRPKNGKKSIIWGKLPKNCIFWRIFFEFRTELRGLFSNFGSGAPFLRNLLTDKHCTTLRCNKCVLNVKGPLVF